MASYTQELSWLLRGFSDVNDSPDLFASPRSIIERSYKPFFKAIGDYSFKIWGDERDQAFKEQFEKNFLEFFYMKEYGFQTPDAFILELGSFLRRKMPIYCRHWKVILEEMYVTQTGNVSGNTQGVSNSNDSRQTDSWSKANSHATSDSESNASSAARGGMTDTPQNELKIDLKDLKYATQVNASENVSDSTTSGTNDTESNSEDHTTSKGNAVGNKSSQSVTDNYGRNKDVFDIYDQWITSGYDLFTPLYKQAMEEQLFVVFN